MLAERHRKKAEDNELTIAELGDPATKAHIRPTLFELYWGTAFHWMCYGCQQKYGQHHEQHAGLVGYLRAIGEGHLADVWEQLENLRLGGWYGHQDAPWQLQRARQAWEEIRTWALS